jgi:hypothetical protein
VSCPSSNKADFDSGWQTRTAKLSEFVVERGRLIEVSSDEFPCQITTTQQGTRILKETPSIDERSSP